MSHLIPVAAIARVTVLEGVRTRLPGLVVAVWAVGMSLAWFAGALAVMETEAVQAAVAGFFLRLGAVLVLTLFVLNAQVREFNDKGVDLVLSLPVPRAGYLFGRIVGYAMIALAVAILFAGGTCFFAPGSQSVLWGVSLFFELMLVIALSLFSLLTFSQVPPAFALVMAVYLLARSVIVLQWIGQGPIMPQGVLHVWLMNRLIDALAFVLPALDRLTRSDWLVYGTGGWDDLIFVVVQGGIYLSLLVAAALIDLYRKNF
ncbi:MAG: ABC transporter permease [Magnetococcales bacterium]|nr:ABC transporter permease [Magnetococcales bacterium]MBF0148938.1 ABC transporter permease [Magnetococcales bacterium]MBF0173912.1 ABC transporter permease [Magnetococcales bacterium]MBF0629692.1 ABC transporter permease [Magnetococcales bacterium]